MLGLLAVPSIPVPGQNGGPAGLSSSGLSAAFGSNSTTFTLNGTTIDVSSTFWGTTISARARLLPDETNVINATSTQVIVWPGGSAGDDYNPLNNTMVTYVGCSHYIHPPNCGYTTYAHPSTSDAAFAQWCLSVRCSTIFEVPGEVDNSSLAAQIVNYTENTLGLHPLYWEIGNEPELWTHWKVPWTKWTTDHSNVTPVKYAWEVHNYTVAMRAVDPHIRILGVAATARNNGKYPMVQWIYNTTLVNGNNIAGVAFHEYPAGRNGAGVPATLNGFYSNLTGPSNVSTRVGEARSAVALGCTNSSVSCTPSNIPVLVTEIGSGLSNYGYGQFSIGFPGALSMAVQEIQAIDVNVTNMDLFASELGTSNSWFDFTGVERPDYTSYTQFLNRLGSQAHQLRFPQMNTSLFGIDTIAPNDGNRRDLLVVNTNLSSGAQFTPQFADGNLTTLVEAWLWQGKLETLNGAQNAVPLTIGPVPASYAGGLPSSYTLPPQSMVLFESYPTAATPVQFQAHGLQNYSGLRWFLDVGGNISSTRTSNFTRLLSIGSVPVSGNAVPLPIGGTERVPKERLEPFVASPVVVGSSPEVVPVYFTTQWAVNLVSEPAQGGSISPVVQWANASEPLHLTADPSTGFAFDRWYGSGVGSFTGPGNPAVITPGGPVVEKANFTNGFFVNFTESGLRPGTAWSASLRGDNQFSTNSTIPFFVANGTYGFQIGNLSDYRAHPPAGSVTVNGSSVDVLIQFVQKTPPPANYTIIFTEFGLPAGTNWSVSLRGGAPVASTTTFIAFSEPNGTWGFSVTNVPGYRAHPPVGSVTVNGALVDFPVYFTPKTPPPPTYDVTFEEVGLPAGTTWSVTLRTSLNSSTTSQLGFQVPNGTYGFKVTSVSGFQARPSAGAVNVTGGPTVELINFTKKTPPGQQYAVTFEETGLPVGTDWSVTFRGTLNSSLSSDIGFNAPNSTNGYGFHVTNVTGYRAHPSAGTVDVSGAPVVVHIAFVMETPPPPDYAVTFVESGLPGGTSWSVTFRGTLSYSLTPDIGFSAPNSTSGYGFQVSNVTDYRAHPPAGSVNVSGAPVIINIVFTKNTPPPPEYAVTFSETGLPTGTNWSVTFRGTLNYSTTTEIVFFALNSTSGYGFQVSNVTDYRAHPPAGSVNVTGAPVTVDILFVKETPPPPDYAVTFIETGLPAKTYWSVTLRSGTITSSDVTIGFSEPNSTYGFKIGVVSGYRAYPPAGSVTVQGGPVDLTVVFAQATPVPLNYTVTFTESGLPSGTSWTVSVRGHTEPSTGVAITFQETNGSYGFQVGVVSGFVRHPPSDGFSVQGGPVIVPVQFVRVRTTYDTVWKETGLWQGSAWWVIVNGTTYTTTRAWNPVSLHNGTYPYMVGDSASFVAAPRSGQVRVQGLSQNLSVNFIQKNFSVTVSLAGLPSDRVLPVHLRIGSANYTLTAGNPTPISLPNGTYTYDILPPSGYYADPSHGNVTINATPVPLSVNFFLIGRGPDPALWSLAARAAAVGAVIGLAGWGGFALMRTVRRRRSDTED